MAVSWRATCRQGSRPARPALYARAGDCGRRRQGPGKDARGRPEHALLDGGLGARKVERRARRQPAEALAGAGAVALALRWFRGDQQPSRPRQVLLETFVGALDLLAPECDRLAILGLSCGAEAALLTAVRDPRLDVAIGLAPTDVAWEGAIRDRQRPAGQQSDLAGPRRPLRAARPSMAAVRSTAGVRRLLPSRPFQRRRRRRRSRDHPRRGLQGCGDPCRWW